MAQLAYKLVGIFVTVCATITLSACGPGTGGTGTGPGLSPTLNAPVLALTPIPNYSVIGTWTTSDAKTSVLIAAEKITVLSNCMTFNFGGTWAVDENQNILRQVGDHSLIISFTNQQMNFEIRNNRNELISSGVELIRVSPEVPPALNQCSN
jgi:hypothetical protein